MIEYEDKLLGGWLDGETVNFLAPILRMLELVGESYPQALLGKLAFFLVLPFNINVIAMSITIDFFDIIKI